MKKIISFCFCILFVLMFSVVGSAKGVLDIGVESVSAFEEDTVYIKINVSSNPGIASARFKLEYDKSRLSLISVTDKGILGIPNFSPAVTTEPYIIGWNFGSAATTDYKSTGEALVLEFKVNSSAKVGDAEINLSYNSGDIFNSKLKDIPVNMSVGKVTVKSRKADCKCPVFEWHTATAASCNNDGIREYRCAECAKVKATEKIAKLTHNYKSAKEDNYTLYTCILCGNSYKDKFISTVNSQVTTPSRDAAVSSELQTLTQTETKEEATVSSDISKPADLSSEETNFKDTNNSKFLIFGIALFVVSIIIILVVVFCKKK